MNMYGFEVRDHRRASVESDSDSLKFKYEYVRLRGQRPSKSSHRRESVQERLLKIKIRMGLEKTANKTFISINVNSLDHPTISN